MYNFTDTIDTTAFDDFLKSQRKTFQEATFDVHEYSKIYPSYVRTYLLKKPFEKVNPDYELSKKKSTQTPIQPITNSYTIDDNGNMVNMMTGEYKQPYTREESLARSIRRTKTVIYDIIQCNQFKWFGTFTFNCRSCPSILQCKNYLKDDDRESCSCPPELCKRFDDEHIKTIMKVWLKNQRRLHGKFDYLLIPERHKNGALHFHGLIGANYSGNMIESGKYYNLMPIYNVTSFQSGFSDFTEIQDKGKTATYVTKYITKEMPQIDGKKRYWASRGLIRPRIEYNTGILDMPFVQHTEKYNNNMFTAYDSSVTLSSQ